MTDPDILNFAGIFFIPGTGHFADHDDLIGDTFESRDDNHDMVFPVIPRSFSPRMASGEPTDEPPNFRTFINSELMVKKKGL